MKRDYSAIFHNFSYFLGVLPNFGAQDFQTALERNWLDGFKSRWPNSRI